MDFLQHGYKLLYFPHIGWKEKHKKWRIKNEINEEVKKSNTKENRIRKHWIRNNKLEENIGDASLEVEESKSKALGLNDFSHINTEDLRQLLQSALEEEDYEKASRIRDELKDRQ